ncbi:MAG TPA: phosphodiester glycosidase family protein [Fimbriimonadaceae bacterium]|nr:phosphodiester glycosidase family protein [Fimbriimonadaceae bacterium]
MLALAIAVSATPAAKAAVGYEVFSQGRNKYHVVTANMASNSISAGMAYNKGPASIWDLVKKDKPLAALTGTFFHMRTHRPVADVLVDGNIVAKGFRGSAVGVDWYGAVQIFDTKFSEKTDWGNFRYGLRGAVRILTDGVVCPNPKAQKFRDSRLWGRAARTAIGTTKHGKVLLVATKSSVTLSELAKALKANGATNAVSLDGGGSTCLYYKGSLVVPPNRKLNNLFVIYGKPPY